MTPEQNAAQDNYRAATENLRAAERMFLAIQLQADIAGMIAENQVREAQGKSPAYGEEAFKEAKDSYHNTFYSI